MAEDTLFGNVIGAVAGALDQAGDAAAEALGNTGQIKGPMRGAYLEYEVEFPTFGPRGGVVSKKKQRLLMKEPIGNWFGLDPKFPSIGKFGGNGGNKGRIFARRAGFRAKSFQVLLKPETQILVPRAKAAEQRSQGGNGMTRNERVANFFIGVGKKTTVNQVIAFLITSKRQNDIIGVISPTNRKYQWGGVLHSATDGAVLLDLGQAVADAVDAVSDTIIGAGN